MPEIVADWQGEMVFDIVDDADMPVDVDGSQRIGVKPSQLLPMALATCSGVDVVQVLGEGPADLRSLSISARSATDSSAVSYSRPRRERSDSTQCRKSLASPDR